MSDFTKGPWKRQFNSDFSLLNNRWTITGADGWLLAEIKGGNCDIDEANARLIAAAPDAHRLLEAVMQELYNNEYVHEETLHEIVEWIAWIAASSNRKDD
jgi:hypothetical protein